MKKIKRNEAQSQIDYNLRKDDTYKGRYNILVKNYYDVLDSKEVEKDQESEEEHVEKEWNKVKLSLQNAAKELLPKKSKEEKRVDEWWDTIKNGTEKECKEWNHIMY